MFQVLVRKDILDLSVALRAFSAEFECLGGLFSDGFNGLIVDDGACIGASAIALSVLCPKVEIIVIKA